MQIISLFSKYSVDAYSPEISIKGQSFTKVAFLQFYALDESTPLSNKILVVDYFLVVKTHPNPKTEEIEKDI
jgi:hypothetical protein